MMSPPRKKQHIPAIKDDQGLIRLDLLGSFSLMGARGVPIAIRTKKNRALLAILALSSAGHATREHLCALLWGDRGEDQARSSLRQSLAVLRKELGDDERLVMHTRDDVVALRLESLRVDARELQSLAGVEEIEPLRKAAALYRGEFLADTSIRNAAFEEWLATARQRLADQAMTVFERLSALETGQLAIDAAKRLVDLDPLREASHRALMSAYLAAGEKGLAIKQYEACGLILKAELGVAPSEDLQELRRSLAADAGSERLPKHAEKPIIAVLPFENMSRDPESQYFSDGITEDITTELARVKSLFVIARNSSFQYRDKAVDVRRIGKELGVHYVVEGSVRRMGKRLRITAQLIEASSGNHLWSERYDRNMEDLFAVQDEVTRTIVATLTGRVENVEISGSIRKPTESLAAYDKLLRGIEHARGYGKDENRLAREQFEEAIAIDPHCALAHAYLALALLLEHDYENAPQQIKEHAVEVALNAVRLDPSESRCHQFLATAYLLRGDFDAALSHFERMLELNPNEANGLSNMGTVLAAVGRAHEGVEMIRLAMRLNPFHPEWYWGDLGFALYDARRYEEALQAFKRIASRKKHWLVARIAACYAQLGRLDEARSQVPEVLRLKPDFRLSTEKLAYKNAADAEHVFEGMRKAGLPE
jgi:TolB-like protein/Tfp pilus assembly protein PilF